jgi:hypothetical protein
LPADRDDDADTQTMTMTTTAPMPAFSDDAGAGIGLRGIVKRYGGQVAVQHLDLEIPARAWSPR